MRLTRSLTGLGALFVACGAPGESGEELGSDELGVLSQALSDTFSGTLTANQTASRGPLAVQPGSQLRVVLSGTGDADLYVRFGARPTLTSYDCRPYRDDAAEQCVLTVPANATAVYVDVRGYTASTYSLQIERVEGGGGGTGGSSGAGGSSGVGGGSSGGSAGSSGGSAGGGGSSGTGGSSGGAAGSGGSAGSSAGGAAGASGSSGGTPIVETFSGTVARNEAVARGPFAVLPGSQLRVVLSGTGDADLYVRFGSRPTLTSYDCRPYRDDTAEQCVLTVPASATSAFVDVRGYTASNYSLQIERVASGGGGSGGSGGSGSGGGAAGSGSTGAGGSGSQGTEPFVIAVLGSSTAEGEGASSLANSWVGLLEHQLSASANVSITNLATGGYTTLELLPGSGAAGGIDAALAEHPDLLVVALAGSNDLDIGTTTANYLARLTQLRDTARAAGIPTFFVGTAPKDLSNGERLQLADWNAQMRSRFASCWVPTSASYSPCFIDIFADLADADLNIAAQYDSDGIHLNDAGHRVIFQDAVEIIEPYLCAVAECH